MFVGAFKPALAYLHSCSSITILCNYETTRIIVRRHCYFTARGNETPAARRQQAPRPLASRFTRFVFEDFVRKTESLEAFLSLALPAYRTMKLFRRAIKNNENVPTIYSRHNIYIAE